MKMKISNKKLFWFGLIFSFTLILSYFIPIGIDGGANYYVQDTLLGILIDHSVIGLSSYVLIAALILASSIEFHKKL